MVNSVTTTAPPPATFCSVPDAPVAALGFVLARRRPLHVASLLSRPLYKAQRPSSTFLSLLYFSRRPCSSPTSSHHRCSASTVRAKRSIASPTPCVLRQPTVVARFRQEPPLAAFLPRGRQHLRRARFAVARAPRSVFARAWHAASSALIP